MPIVRLIIVAGAVLAACTPPSPSTSGAEFLETRTFAMGTWVDVVIEAQGEPEDAAAVAALAAMLHDFEIDYYAWADGELGRVNASLRRGEPARVTGDMARLLERSRELARKSGGRFDPAVGAIVEMWGFHSSLVAPAQPSDDQIGAWLASRPSIEQLTIKDLTVSHSQPGLVLDLGGVAKGEIVDRMLAELLRRGYSDALVNAGGDLAVRGLRGDRPWRVGIQSPRGDGILGTVTLSSGEAVFTSGDYERFFDTQGRRMHHIIDPALGFPATHTQAVTVIAHDGALADAAATAIFVAGPAEWRAVAAALGIDAALRVDSSGAIDMTDSMRARVEISPDIDPSIIVGRS